MADSFTDVCGAAPFGIPPLACDEQSCQCANAGDPVPLDSPYAGFAALDFGYCYGLPPPLETPDDIVVEPGSVTFRVPEAESGSFVPQGLFVACSLMAFTLHTVLA